MALTQSPPVVPEPFLLPSDDRTGLLEREDVVDRTPAYHFASPVPLGMPMDPLLNLLVKLPHQ
jgi:hypothetical protein